MPVSVSERRRRASCHMPARLAASLLERVDEGSNELAPDWSSSPLPLPASEMEDSENREGREGLAVTVALAVESH